MTEEEFTTCGGYRSRGNNTKSDCRNGRKILDNPSKCFYQYQCNYKYWDITKKSQIYDWDALRSRKRCPFMGGENQLWRNQLMAEGIKSLSEFRNAHVSVVYHPGNEDLNNTIDSYKEMLFKDEMKFSSFTSKQLVDEAKKNQKPEI